MNPTTQQPQEQARRITLPPDESIAPPEGYYEAAARVYADFHALFPEGPKSYPADVMLVPPPQP